MTEQQIQLLIDLHKPHHRQGPGGEAETRKALILAGIDSSRPLKIADIGCGTGASTIQLAQELHAHITAVDFLPEFLEELHIRATTDGIAEKITTVKASMDALPFKAGEFDVIWSEGAIYNMGFETGISYWKQFLKPGGKLIVSEITWLTDKRPTELTSHWQGEYPEIDTASAKIKLLEKHGYILDGYFFLPEHCWWDNYYLPIQNGLDAFLARNKNDAVKKIAEGERAEITLYKKYKDYYSYGVYIAQKI